MKHDIGGSAATPPFQLAVSVDGEPRSGVGVLLEPEKAVVRNALKRDRQACVDGDDAASPCATKVVGVVKGTSGTRGIQNSARHRQVGAQRDLLNIPRSRRRTPPQ